TYTPSPVNNLACIGAELGDRDGAERWKCTRPSAHVLRDESFEKVRTEIWFGEQSSKKTVRHLVDAPEGLAAIRGLFDCYRLDDVVLIPELHRRSAFELRPELIVDQLHDVLRQPGAAINLGQNDPEQPSLSTKLLYLQQVFNSV